jgi:hypothetical protein
VKYVAAVVTLLLLCACSSTPAPQAAGSTQPAAAWKYPQQRVTEAEWQALKAETLLLPGAKVEESELMTKITVSGGSKALGDTVMYMFTKPPYSGHPAAAKVTFPLNAKGEPIPDYAFHYAGSEEGFKAFVRGVIIGASVLATEPRK